MPISLITSRSSVPRRQIDAVLRSGSVWLSPPFGNTVTWPPTRPAACFALGSVTALVGNGPGWLRRRNALCASFTARSASSRASREKAKESQASISMERLPGRVPEPGRTPGHPLQFLARQLLVVQLDEGAVDVEPERLPHHGGVCPGPCVQLDDRHALHLLNQPVTIHLVGVEMANDEPGDAVEERRLRGLSADLTVDVTHKFERRAEQRPLVDAVDPLDLADTVDPEVAVRNRVDLGVELGEQLLDPERLLVARPHLRLEAFEATVGEADVRV